MKENRQKSPICECSRSNLMPVTTEIALLRTSPVSVSYHLVKVPCMKQPIFTLKVGSRKEERKGSEEK